MFFALWRLFLSPDAELGHHLFSSPCYGRPQRQLFPSIIPDILFVFFPLLFVSPFVSLSFLLVAPSGFLCATVTASHGYKMSAKVLVKGFARISWVTFSTLMWTGRCRKHPTIMELMWNVLVLICFILQLYHCLERKTWIMEKINDPFLAKAWLTFLIVFICSELKDHQTWGNVGGGGEDRGGGLPGLFCWSLNGSNQSDNSCVM